MMSDVFDDDAGQSEQPLPPIDELAAALAKAQGAMKNAVMNRINPHFKSKYADLAAILDAIRKPFSENGLSVVQLIRRNVLHTILLHTSGQLLISYYPFSTAGRPQEVGSALTYARRYSLSALVGIAADEDDDGNAAKRENPHVTQAADIVDVPPPDDPDRIPTPKEPVPELPKMQQREVGDKLGKELAACKTIADTENWKNLESTSYRAWQLREMWRETLQGKVKEKLMELRGAAAQAAFEHEQEAHHRDQYTDPE